MSELKVQRWPISRIPRSPQWLDDHQIWFWGISNDVSPLTVTQGLNYCSPHYYLRRRRRLCFYFGLFVCLSDNLNSCERILTKFLGGVGHGPRTNEFNFGDDPDHRPDPWVRSPKSGFSGLSKKYIVDSDQSCIANLHRKNHSAILLCWRSADVCALWVLLVGYSLMHNITWYNNWLCSMFNFITQINGSGRQRSVWFHGYRRTAKGWQ